MSGKLTKKRNQENNMIDIKNILSIFNSKISPCTQKFKKGKIINRIIS